jgi:hypothetical protein
MMKNQKKTIKKQLLFKSRLNMLINMLINILIYKIETKLKI